jgi:hypothetical protein
MRRIVPQTFRQVFFTQIDTHSGATGRVSMGIPEWGFLKKGRGTKNCVGKGLVMIVNEARSYDGQVFFD